MPTWEEMLEQGVYKRPVEPYIAFEAFRNDPSANPLGTPSGKIEIFSEALDEMSRTWDLEEGEVIYPIPVFQAGFHGYGSVTEEFPLYCCGFHHKSRTHSSFGFIPELEAVARQQLWVNPADAESRSIEDGDLIAVTSPVGEIRIEAKVTPRVIPRNCNDSAGRLAQGQHEWRQGGRGRLREHAQLQYQTNADGQGQRHSLHDRPDCEGLREVRR